MAATPKNLRDKNPPPPPDDEDEDKADIAAVMEAIEEASNESDTASTWVVSVTRVQGGRGVAEARLFHCTPAEIPGIEDKLRAEWGEGHYRVRVRYRNAQFKQFDLPIEFSPLEKRQWAEKIADLGRTSSSTPASDGGQLTAQERFFAQLTERLAAPPAPAVDPFEMFERVMDVVEKRMGLAGDRAPAVDPVEQINQTLSIVEKLKTVTGGDAGAGAGDGGGGMWAAIGSFVNSDMGKALAAGLIQTFAPQLAGAPPAAARVAPPAPAAIAPNALPPQLNQAITYLVDQAQRGADPKLAADWVLDQLPAGILQMLDAQGDIVAYLEHNFPAVAVHRAWFGALVENLWEGEEAAPAPAPGPQAHDGATAHDSAKSTDRDSGRSGGDAGNPQANAPTRQAG